jgi:hypothetical protein
MSIRFKTFLFIPQIILIYFSTSLSQTIIFQKPLSPRIANYTIDVNLDPNKRTINGHEILTWFNKSNDKISELQFHLYMNAFRNNRSTFMKESRRSKKDTKEDNWGFCDIKKLK